jgi:hypothetical protein
VENTASVEKQDSRLIWGLLISIIDKPRDTFAYLVANTRLKWILPLLLMLIVLIVSVWITVPFSSELAEKSTTQQLNQAGLSPEQAEQAMAQSATFRSPMFLGIMGSVFGSIFIIISWVAAAAYFYFASLITGAELKFGSVFNIVAWSNLPKVLQTLVQAILVAVTGNFPMYTGLAALQVSGDVLKDAANPMIGLLSFVDIFWIWHIILLVIGLAVATKFSRLKTFLIVLVYVAASIGLGVISNLIAGLSG